MNAILSTSQQAAIRTSNAQRAIYDLPRMLRVVLKTQRNIDGRYEQWSQAIQDLHLGDYLLSQNDIESQLGDALLRLLPHAREIAEHLQNGDECAMGKILANAIRAEFDTLMGDVVDQL